MVATREFARSRVEQQGLQAREVPADYFQAITRKRKKIKKSKRNKEGVVYIYV